MRNKRGDSLWNVIIRYLILIAVAIPNLFLFYIIFNPLTVLPVYFLLGLFFDASLFSSSIILLNGFFPIELIEACIASSAYYLLLILNLATPGLKLKTRIYSILFSFAVFLVINILRIFILSLVAISGSPVFDITHKVFWYLVSTLFVVGIWFAEIKLFKIKEIPIYSDLKNLYDKSSLRK